jgi:hypothetical protein
MAIDAHKLFLKELTGELFFPLFGTSDYACPITRLSRAASTASFVIPEER